MKEIVDGKLWDTDKSKKICDLSNLIHSIWKTQKGNLFLVNDAMSKITNTNQKEVKEILGKEDPEKYMKLYGKVPGA